MATPLIDSSGSVGVGGIRNRRPSVGRDELGGFSKARRFNSYARKADSPGHRGYVPYQGANNLQITMINGATTLSTVTPIDTYSMRFDWQHFH